MKRPVGILIVAVIVTLGSTLLSNTQGAESPSAGTFSKPPVPGIVRPNPNVQPGPQFLLQKITELEKKVGDLQQEVQFLKTHRHPYEKTRLPSGCGWMNISNFLYQIEHNPDFKTKCGLLVGSTTPDGVTGLPGITDKPVK